MPQTKKTFRLFISSTFDDFKIERNALQEEVFPKLRDLCIKQGFRFQAIDLRWGISDEAGRDHKTIQMCLDEIKRCQETKLKPNFIVLLGNRYGNRPLPLQIDAEEFEDILNKVSLADKELICWSNGQNNMKKSWYRNDKNAEPPKYVLRARDIPENIYGKEKQEALEKEAADWEKIEIRMRNIFLNAIEKLGWKKDDPLRVKYEASVMHREIEEGILKVKNAGESAFAFFRTIRNIPYNQASNNYVEQDTYAKKRLDFINAKLKEQLPEIFPYEVEWVGAGIKNEPIVPVCIKGKNEVKNNPIKKGISKLCQDVYDNVSEIIKQEIDRFEERTLEVEIERHKSFGNKHAEFFTGRDEQLKKIINCLDSLKCRLLAVYGKPGSGKSALIARSSQLAHEKYPNAHIITRYIGIHRNRLASTLL
jgi:hypothetical protein